jgi:ATP-dependent RNA helicase RhlE
LNFNEFGFDPRLLEGIEAMGFTTATKIQEQAIPLILEGKDLIGSAQTGTGKTAAFLLPITHKLLQDIPDRSIKALIIVPTRELAVQIDQHMEGLSYFTSVSSIAIYGGTDGAAFSKEKLALTEGADIVVCTPGRMIAHLNMGYVNLEGLEYLVLDEADRMLDMGFVDDIMKIITYLPVKRQTLLFSATMPKEIRILAGKVLTNPEEIRISLSKPVEKILQLAYVVYEPQKIPLLKFILQPMKDRSVLVFCSSKSSTKELARELKKLGLTAEDIHSDLAQDEREKVLMSFRNRELKIMVATDILSRGIDIENIDMVINFDVPHDGEDYIHRIGRTARAEASGVAITLISPRDQYKFAAIEKLLEKPVHKAVVPVQFGEAPSYDPKKQDRGQSRRFNPKGNQRNRSIRG